MAGLSKESELEESTTSEDLKYAFYFGRRSELTTALSESVGYRCAGYRRVPIN